MEEALEADPQFQSRVYPAHDNNTSAIRLHSFELELRGGGDPTLFSSFTTACFGSDGMVQPFHAHTDLGESVVVLMPNVSGVHDRGDAKGVALHLVSIRCTCGSRSSGKLLLDGVTQLTFGYHGGRSTLFQVVCTHSRSYSLGLQFHIESRSADLLVFTVFRASELRFCLSRRLGQLRRLGRHESRQRSTSPAQRAWTA